MSTPQCRHFAAALVVGRSSSRRRPTIASTLAALLLAVGTVAASSGALAAARSGWQVEYSGDLSGTIRGGILVPGGTSMVSMVRGNSMSKDMKSMGTAAISIKVMSLPGQSPALRQLDVTLEDGNVCRLSPDGSERFELRDESSKSYDATFSATLQCDGGQQITATVTAKK